MAPVPKSTAKATRPGTTKYTSAIEQALREATGVDLAAHWNDVQVLQEGAGVEPVALRLGELDACARSEDAGAGLDAAAEPRAGVLRSCARP